MNKEIFSNISKIIERDSKSTTYKFALLRGTIDLIQENSPFIEFKEDRVHFPMGLLIEKWMVYYYPIFDSSLKIPQINGDTKLSFERLLCEVVTYYQNRGGLSAFYSDLKRNGVSQEMTPTMISLANQLNATIRKMPMYYLGRSISSDFHSIFKPEQNRKSASIDKLDSNFLALNYGSYSIPRDYYDAFEILGSFISGQDSIFLKWAEFSFNASRKSLPLHNILEGLLESPVKERDSEASKGLFDSLLKKMGETECVWTNERTEKIEVDHVIPFAIWKNNDLWNLLPAIPKINNNKRDKIPTPGLIERRKEIILHYWIFWIKASNLGFKKKSKLVYLETMRLQTGKF